LTSSPVFKLSISHRPLPLLNTQKLWAFLKRGLSYNYLNEPCFSVLESSHLMTFLNIFLMRLMSYSKIKFIEWFPVFRSIIKFSFNPITYF
jgi:hypothetical protein